MAIQRLKIDPEAVDLMVAAIILARENRVQHAGHYAFLALGKIVAKNLPGEPGPTTPTNFRRRLELLSRKKDFPEETGEEVYSAWEQIKYYIDHKVSFVPSHRARKVRNYVELIQHIIEDYTGVDFNELIADMTFADLERLHLSFGDKLLSQRKEEAPFQGFTDRDFENLFTLRDTLAAIGSELSQKIKAESKQLAGPLLSRIDFTSAYVTLSFNGNPLRAPGEEASFSTMLTNDYLLAGLYLGDRSKATRTLYYQHLLAGKMEEALSAIGDLGGELLDTFWYYNLENRIPLARFLQRPGSYQEEMRRKVERAQKNLEHLPYTWNILLPAKVWPKEAVCKLDSTIVEKIWELYPPIYQIIENLTQ